MRVLGCDPGKVGAIALIDGLSLLRVFDMPVTALKKGTTLDAHTLNGLVCEMLNDCGPVDLAVIERVHSTPQMGVSSAFDFGRSFGLVEMALIARGIRIEYITPQRWKAALGLTADKSSSLALARAKWPDAEEWFRRKKDEGRAEAALIAEYGRRSSL